MGRRALSAAVVVLGLFLLLTTKGVILGLPIWVIAVLLILIGAYGLVRTLA